MKRITTLLLSLAALSATAQVSIKPVEQEIAKVKRVGYTTSTTVDSKIVEAAWKKKLAEYGRVVSERSGVYKVEYARLPFYDKNVLLVSQLSTKRNNTDLFVSVDMGNYEFASSTNVYGRELEKILRDFHEEIDYQSQVADSDKTLKDASDKHKDLVRKSERNVRNLSDNRNEKVRLLKKLQENEKELGTLQADSVQLKTDLETAIKTVDDQKKTNEAVKARKPKQ
ncbi:hypothetical protein [Siphonobacter aquaeclarae]|jgi:hypothetical protein|uniref:DUF4468 domain-containing protein n=1 Tax=Siphonobacter aquaeclarae TaxID=563176 RepID=A0A1G9SX91_9BACT|nr:hypothetical protein [Siphonobacter aquaeclarae]MBO9636692.1 hypothetical protein [Siphonobacter aquaeclarae]SDM40013.1 hypothetical protein SAMN04488090_3331 [Siphonobacter aquaeclarae]